MENINNNLYAMSDEAILQLIGNFLLETRLQQNKSQEDRNEENEKIMSALSDYHIF